MWRAPVRYVVDDVARTCTLYGYDVAPHNLCGPTSQKLSAAHAASCSSHRSRHRSAASRMARYAEVLPPLASISNARSIMACWMGGSTWQEGR